MSELNRIKTVLFNASNLEEALTKLIDLGFTYHEPTINKCFVLKVDGHDIEFWPVTDNQYALAVIINKDFQFYDDRVSFLACQPDAVPAASPEKIKAGERPITFTCTSCKSQNTITMQSEEFPDTELFTECIDCSFAFFHESESQGSQPVRLITRLVMP